MRKRFDPQLSLGAVPIEKVHIEERPRDELPAVLKALQWIFKTREVNEEIFTLLEEKMLKDKEETGRPGMDLWRVLVLGVLKNTLDIDFSRLEDLANNHRLIRQIMGLNGFMDSEEEKFNYQTICDNVNQIDAQLLEKINVVVARQGREMFKKKAAKKE